MTYNFKPKKRLGFFVVLCMMLLGGATNRVSASPVHSLIKQATKFPKTRSFRWNAVLGLFTGSVGFLLFGEKPTQQRFVKIDCEKTTEYIKAREKRREEYFKNQRRIS